MSAGAFVASVNALTHAMERPPPQPPEGSFLAELLTLLIEWTRKFEEQLWRLQARWNPRYRGSAWIAHRLELPALVEYLYLEQSRPEGLRGTFSNYVVPPDFAEQCAKEFQARVGREITPSDFDRSRLYWGQFERQGGKPTYTPAGLDSVRSAMSKAEDLNPPPSFKRAPAAAPERPAEPEAPADSLDEIDAIFQDKHKDSIFEEHRPNID